MKYYKHILIILSISLCNEIVAQPDDDYNLNLIFEDNFNAFDAAKWIKEDASRNNEFQWYENASKNLVYQYNSTAGSNVLTMKAYMESPPLYRENKYWNYSSGQLYSMKSDFLYGYYEVRCRMPLFLRSFPAFWLTNDNDNDIHEYEIDVMEFKYDRSNEYSTNYFDWWTLDPPGNTDDHKYNRPMWIATPDISSGFHTFGIDWSPDHLYFYYDNKMVRFVKDTYISDKAMFLILNLAIHNQDNGSGLPACPGGCDPYEVDYVRVYEHNCAAKGIAINKSNFFTSPTYGVHKSYTLSNSTVPSGAHVVLRATDFVTLQNNFIVPAGSEFYVVMTQCP